MKAGEVDSASLKQLVLSWSPRQATLLVFAYDDWDDYREPPDPSEAALRLPVEEATLVWESAEAAAGPEVGAPGGGEPGEVPRALGGDGESNGSKGPAPVVRFADERLEASYRAFKRRRVDALVEIARALASESALFGRKKKVVGISACGISTSGYADLVAFTHPQGDKPLWPVREHRSEDEDVYGHAVLVPEGLVVFYPEGDDPEADEPGPSVREYRFDRMARYWNDAYRGLSFQMRGADGPIGLSAGMTHEEHGGPDTEAVDAALLAHFESRPELRWDPISMPHPSDVAAYSAWWKTYRALGTKRGASVVARAFEAHGLEAAERFVVDHAAAFGGADDAEEAIEVQTAFARALLAASRFERCLEVLLALDVRARESAAHEQLECFLALGRLADADKLARRLALRKEWKAQKGKLSPYQARILARGGDGAGALALLDAVPEDAREDLFWLARAEVLATTSPEAAAPPVSALERAYALGADDASVARLLRAVPRTSVAGEALRAVVEARAARDAHWRATSADARAKATWITPSRLAIPSDTLRRAATEAAPWVTSELPEGGAFPVKRVSVDPRGAVFAALGARGFGQLHLADGELRLVETPYDGAIEDIAASARDVCAADYARGLVVFERPATEGGSGSVPVGAHARWGRAQASRVARDPRADGVVALVSNPGVELFDVRVPSAPKRIAFVGVACEGVVSYAEAAAFSEATLFVAASDLGLVTVDVKEPEAPRILAALGADLGGVSVGGAARRLSAKDVVLVDDVAVVLGRDGPLWFVDVRDPERPRSLGVVLQPDVRIAAIACVGGPPGARALLALDEERPLLHRFEVGSGGVVYVESAPIVADGGGESSLTGVKALIAAGTLASGVASGTSDATEATSKATEAFSTGRLYAFGRTAMNLTRAKEPLVGGAVHDALARLEQRVGAQVAAWATEHLGAPAPFPLGVVSLTIQGAGLALEWAPPRALAAFDTPEDLDPDPLAIRFEGDLDAEVSEAGESLAAQVVAAMKRDALRRAAKEALSALAREPRVAERAAGRVYFIATVGDSYDEGGLFRSVEAVLEFPGRPWEPRTRDGEADELDDEA
jgi:hypothetical protein